MNNKILIKKAENQVRQQLFGGILLAVAGLMIVNTFISFPTWKTHAAADNTNLTFNVTAGTFSIDNVITSIAFASQTYGFSATNLLGNNTIDSLAVTDYRGNAQAWSVVVNANNFSDGTNTISVANLKVWPGNGAVANVENFDTNQVAKGTNNAALSGAGANLLNGSTAASGIMRYDNGILRLTLAGTESAGVYGAVATFTLL